MRPTPGANALPVRSRGLSFSDNDATPMPPQFPSQGGGMTYFLTDEKSLEGSSSTIQTSQARPRYGVKSGMYGVESLESTTSSLGSSRQPPSPRIPANKKPSSKPRSRQSEDDFQKTDLASSISIENGRDVLPYDGQPRCPSQMVSQSPTPLFPASPAPESIASSAHSRRGSDLESLASDIISQVVSSSGEEDTELTSEVTDNGSAPQLVMPSIKMPSRRPFTEKGRNMGRLKVMIAGGSGIGKTSLIKAIVQACEDIVHVDPLSTTSLSASNTTHGTSRSKSKSSIIDNTTHQLSEIYASTKAYPSWWSEFDEGRVLRRRKSMGDTVLERNLCFVDSPGYGTGTSFMEVITPVISYIEEQVGRTGSAVGMSESDFISMLSGNGGTHVDAIFYVISKKLMPLDIEYLRRLSPLTNIIPVLAQSDRFNGEEIGFQKRQVLSELQVAGIRPFLFGMTLDEALSTNSPCAPWAVSSITTTDNDNMDASILMSPDYIQPLLKTDLQALVSLVFERDSISWLRHSTAKKILSWKKKSSPSPSPLYSPSLSLGNTNLTPSTSSVLPPIDLANSYALARVADHTQREQRYAQVRLAKWANELQRSIENERARYEALCRGDRAVWLTERLSECVQDGTLVPISRAYQKSSVSNKNRNTLKDNYSGMRAMGTFDPRDPLGLLSFDKEMRRQGWVVLQVLGGAGVLGGLVWLARTWGEGWNWGVEWNRLGMDW